MTESVNERYERLAGEFHRETGLMAPGKDVPAAMGDVGDPTVRWREWEKWLERRAAWAAEISSTPSGESR